MSGIKIKLLCSIFLYNDVFLSINMLIIPGVDVSLGGKLGAPGGEWGLWAYVIF